ncbi:hypothetical protein BH10BAC2_BH10BAC2_41140 [soil metagenome]
MELHLKIIGGLMIILSLVHLIFPAYFKWKTEFASLSLINKQVMYVHTFFIALTVLMMGLLCLTSANDLMNTAFGKKVVMALFVFWLIRLLVQFFGYSPALWKGKKFETIVHILFSLLWIYICSVLFIVYYY